MIKWASTFFIFFTFAFNSQAVESISNSFDNSNWVDSGDLIINILEGRVESPLAVRIYDNGSGNEDALISVGDGRHGEFNSSTWVNFDSDGDISDNIIRIDTDEYSDLQFTNFELDNGFTIYPIGNSPLIIRSLSNISIDGTIDCAGEDGEDVDSDKSQTTQGGSARCGGGAGGDGGSVDTSPQDGTSLTSTIDAGGAGPSGDLSDGNGGGGGGSFTVTGGTRDPEAGTDNAAGAGGASGTISEDNIFSELIGGAGGGGGSAFETGGGDDSAGGAGGGGGGVIYMTALGDIDVSSTGEVLATGGDGGGNTGGTLQAGGGGGGGGGGILMFAFGNVSIDAAATVSAERGEGGQTDFSVGDSDGGRGGQGRTWVTDNDFTVTGGGSETPAHQFVSKGIIRYASGTNEIISKSIDLKNTLPTLLSTSDSINEATGSTLTLEFSFGNRENFSPSTWENVSDISQSSQRYLRYRITIDQADSQNPSYIDEFTLQYDPYVEQEFEFSSGCGSIKGTNTNSTGLLLVFLLSFVGLFTIRFLVKS